MDWEAYESYDAHGLLSTSNYEAAVVTVKVRTPSSLPYSLPVLSYTSLLLHPSFSLPPPSSPSPNPSSCNPPPPPPPQTQVTIRGPFTAPSPVWRETWHAGKGWSGGRVQDESAYQWEWSERVNQMANANARSTYLSIYLPTPCFDILSMNHAT